MSKLCKYCGAEMDDEAFECPECLKKIPGAEMLAKQKELEKKEKRKKNLIIIGTAVAVILLITGITFLVKKLNTKPSDKYMKPVRSYIDGCVENEYDEFISAFPEFIGQFMSEQFAYAVIGDIPEEEEKIRTADLLYLDQYYRTLAEKFGVDFDIDYTINSEKRYTPEELEKYQEEYRNYNTELLKNTVFSDGYEITVTFTAKGNLGSNSVTEENFQVFCINDKWYMMSYVDFLKEAEDITLDNLRQ